MSPRFVIVGAGEAGVHAARALRDLGHDGEVILVGAERHVPYERPPLSKFGAASPGVGPRPVGGPDALAGIGFVPETLAVEIRRDARRVRTDTGAIVAYDRLLLATGARPRPLLTGSGPAHGVCYLRTLDDAAAIGRHMRPGARIVVVGGGLIGLELAAGARSGGAEVTVLEAQASVLRRGLPSAVAEAVAARHRAEGVRILCGIGIESIEADGGAQTVVRLAGGEEIAADLVVAGTGSMPETGLASACGLAVDDGILVDAAMRTADPDIFAAGDCCRFPAALYGGRLLRLESWRSAQEQGRIAAAGMLGVPADAGPQVPWFWSDQYDLGVQAAGLFDLANETVLRTGAAGALLAFGLAADGTLVAAAGVAPGTAIARDIKLAEMMIARRLRPDAAALADPGVGLKSMLSQASREQAHAP